MFLERLLQINMATLAALSTVLLDMGQRDRVLAPLVVLAALASVWITDVKRWFRLNRLIANLGGLAAVLLALRETLRFEGETRILTIGSLLVFLQVILLFQEKDERVYWQMIMLSLLQVVVATLFNQGVWFGFLLVLHTLVALSALLLLFMFRQWRSHRPETELPPTDPADATRRWPLATLQSGFSSAPAGSGRSGLGRELFRRLAWMALGTLAMTLLVFFTVPRLGESAWRGAITRQRHMIGFDDRVKLGALGSLVENREEVLRVQLLDESTGRTFPLRGELYLRGAVLTQYERGQWSCPEYAAGRQVLPPPCEQDDVPPVRQIMEIEPADRPELFCVWPFVATQPNEALLLDFAKQRLVRTHESCRRLLQYELGTYAIVDGRQSPLNSWREPGVGVAFEQWHAAAAKEQLLQVPDLPRLATLAKRWDRESGLPAKDRLQRAEFLERRLRDSGLFQYSLEGCRRNPDLDPIEDFVSEHQQGHCEYFATALALMLRSRGIPSRVVLGYRCDEWNSVGRYYQVRQLHAHAWVEAYLEGDQIPAEALTGNWREPWAEGAWLRLDATAAAGDVASSADTSLWDRLTQSTQWLQSLWDNYVLDMDRQRQRDAVYQPLLDAVENAYTTVTDPDSWSELGDSLGRLFSFLPSAGTFGWWIWTVLLVLSGLAAMLLTGWGLRRLVRRLWPRLAGRNAATAVGRKVEIDFYRRLEVLLARHGLVRAAGQTQREFAAAAGLRVAALARRPSLAPLAGQVADAFYRVRFGGVPLDNPQAEAVEQALAQLAADATAVSSAETPRE